jgi:serine/threonine protein kinase
MTNLEGQTFAGYEVLALLGRGGMGAVYKARQPLFNRFIALKIMSAELATDPDFVARFKREAAAARSCSLPPTAPATMATARTGREAAPAVT